MADDRALIHDTTDITLARTLDGPFRGKLVEMTFTRSFIELHVRLLNEGREIFRPTRGLKMGAGLFKLVASPNYDSEGEAWEFLPGTVVRVEMHGGPNGNFPLAVKP